MQIDTHVADTIANDIIDMVIKSAIPAYANDSLAQSITKKTERHCVVRIHDCIIVMLHEGCVNFQKRLPDVATSICGQIWKISDNCPQVLVTHSSLPLIPTNLFIRFPAIFPPTPLFHPTLLLETLEYCFANVM